MNARAAAWLAWSLAGLCLVMFVATFLLFVLAVALYGAFALAERRLVSWKGSPS